MGGVLKTVSVVLMSVLVLLSTVLLVYSQTLNMGNEAHEEVTEADTEPVTGEETTAVEPVADVPDEPENITFEIVKIDGGDPLCEHSWPMWIDTVPAGVGKMGTAISYCPTCGAVQTKMIDALPDPNFRYMLDVENILQNPELPNGCEIVSLAIVLNYLGFQVDPVELSDKYLPKGVFWYDTPYEKYIGDPKTENGTGCYAPCIVNAANDFLKDMDSTLRCKDVSGSTMEELQAYVDAGIPVIIWGTVFMDCDPTVCYSYPHETGLVTWYTHSHCLVMIGHSGSTYIFADPLCGIMDYDKEDVQTSYEQEFMQA
ncbi:MAG: C39 family peptidase, partial [Clostridia bacterium]|nr:C39 family peptidase [Clostridia bacterium]